MARSDHTLFSASVARMAEVRDAGTRYTRAYQGGALPPATGLKQNPRPATSDRSAAGRFSRLSNAGEIQMRRSVLASTTALLLTTLAGVAAASAAGLQPLEPQFVSVGGRDTVLYYTNT